MDAFHLAKTIVTKLTKTGYIAYFAGGWVRDYVMGHPSEDIDIATNATPIEIIDLFPQTILVGLAFGVVIVVSEGHQFEVATFRKDLPYRDGRRPEGIEMSTPQEDALRRDFTINGMFYDPLKEEIHDYVKGREDIQRHLIRTIGNPHERFFEDRLRLLRAFRFATRFGFSIDLETQQAIRENADKLFPAVAPERVWQEFNKMAAYPNFDQAIVEMHRLTLLGRIFPELEAMPLNELKHLVQRYHYFPPRCPTIVYLMALFPSLAVEQKIEIAKRIKASNRDIKLIEFLDHFAALVKAEEEKETLEPYGWIQTLAHPDYLLGLMIIAASYSESESSLFLQRHQQRFLQLETHIKRIKDKAPLVSATFLQKQGIRPGKQMGLLLKEAEKIAVNENYQHPELVLSKLSHSSLWKSSL